MTEDWQPIETAPRRGTMLLYDKVEGPFVGGWAPGLEGWHLDPAGYGADSTRMHEVTHWMPLPAPPK